ncbi:MAG: hypothetical protein NC541_00755 [bacterium]|nr:hypothetical protein [bacterium]
MEEKGTNLIASFDSMYTTDRIRMLKIILPWLPPSGQGGFAVYIKLLELQHTFFLLRRPLQERAACSRRLSSDLFSGDTAGTVELLDELLPFSGPSERSRIENLKGLLQNMGKMKEMMEMMEMMKELFPDGFGGNTGDPMEMLSGMAGMDLSAVFDMFGKEDKTI